LFGTNTETSDKDYKGVFLPEASDILLGKFNQVIHDHTNNSGNKNTKDDIDIEFYSLDKFLTMLYQGQTVALELLYTPKDMILEAHPIWYEIQADYKAFQNKRVDSFLGYAKQQAHKYGIRGSRLNAVERSLEIFNQYQWNQLLGEVSDEHFKELDSLEHIEWINKEFMGNKKELLSICGKKFELNTMLKYVKDPLARYYSEYGERSKLAKQNEGVDWKALSHAVRVSMQAISLLDTGRIELPMSGENIVLLKEIKAGKLSFERVSNIVETHLDKVLEAQSRSSLPAEPNLEAFQKWQIKIYKMIINGEV
jgi:predicted nucleotidyltransferase